MKMEILGEAARNPEVRRSARRIRRRYRNLADALLTRLLAEGAAQGLVFEDIEQLIALEPRPTFMRSIIVELALCSRRKLS